jgi:hypothetical protein
MSRKRGKLSKEEENFIHSNCLEMSIEEMASKINRTVDPVKRYLREHDLKQPEIEEDKYYSWKSVLHEKPYWPILKKQFTEEELEYFEDSWIRHYVDFGGDVKHGEDLQLKNWITLDIRMDQNQMRQHRFRLEEERINEILDYEHEKSLDERDIDSVTRLEQQVSARRGALDNYSKTYLELLKQSKEIATKLKASRDQRKNISDNAQENWPAFQRMLADPEHRDIFGRDLELRRIAAEKSTMRMSQWHKYGDGEVDQPFLTPETVKDE